jgi:SAM-dependent methyltransferase
MPKRSSPVATFDERAADWDTPERVARAEALAEAFVAALPIEPGTRAIELGAGTGLLGLAIRRLLGPGSLTELLLTDTSGGMLDVAAAKIRDQRRTGVRTARYDIAVDPPPDGAPFDLALSLLVLHHVEDTAAVLRAIHGLLRSGGRLALSDLDTEDGSFHDADAEGIHHHGFDRGRLEALAGDAGFFEIRITTAGTTEREGRTYPLFLMTARAR